MKKSQLLILSLAIMFIAGCTPLIQFGGSKVVRDPEHIRKIKEKADKLEKIDDVEAQAKAFDLYRKIEDCECMDKTANKVFEKNQRLGASLFLIEEWVCD